MNDVSPSAHPEREEFLRQARIARHAANQIWSAKNIQEKKQAEKERAACWAQLKLLKKFVSREDWNTAIFNSVIFDEITE